MCLILIRIELSGGVSERVEWGPLGSITNLKTHLPFAVESIGENNSSSLLIIDSGSQAQRVTRRRNGGIRLKRALGSHAKLLDPYFSVFSLEFS